MELLQLKYFQTVARLEHMTKAAEELRIAQPSLSKTIARLEKDLGIPLFDRQGRQIALNSYGKVFLKRVERVFHELSEGKRDIKDLAELQQDSITLAVSIPRILPELLGSFLLEHRNVRFQQFLASTPSMKRQLDDMEIDFCISSIPIEGDEIVWEPLMTEEIFLVVPSGHRFSNRKSIHLYEVKDEPFISMNTGYGFRQLTDQFCKEAGFTPHIAFEVDEPSVISDLIKQGLGIAFVPSLTLLKNSVLSSNRLRIIEPNCKRTIGLSWSKRRYLSKTAQQFREFVINYFSTISSN
ncbi:LysR family transcriptional regulator [Bacillus clarus]|uniref:HTH-type transcriptional regulator CzcR n=1 Tax=Bacillus clarus TaxID=2338372 RepID=A0A090YZS0_9BACI|nr:LysR family transcriptional regulator [Bacillus clarus]KFN03435.1 bacterial regulatory helix-turn-helix, lysR family protein [Bacillus clarus]RFT66926.1 LysR family transcriptional regulator [Bacillus clarus]